MLCERCGKNEANVQVQAFSMDGQSRTLHLCAECLAKQKEEMGREGADFAQFMGALFGKLADRMKQDGEMSKAVCPACGMTYKEFREGGMLGCEQCYGAFREKIEELLLKRNDSVRWVVTEEENPAVTRTLRIRGLRARMKKAIESEDYEQAATLRDEIHALEQQA